MINLNAQLQRIMESQNLEGLKPFAHLYRNKWVEEESGSGDAGHFELESTPLDISSMIVKPNTLSMTLDVTEIAQYNANNVTLTLTDPFNRFIEGTPLSYFPNGYQLYGSRVILYYGTSTADMVSLFVGVIKDLPTHKPEQYQIDLKLISPLELLNDIEAKDFSNKYVGEELDFVRTEDQNKVYETANTGVGGFNAVYADGVKIFEGVDYEVSQTNTLGFSALVTIINAEYHNSDITADYYCWKTGLTVEQIVAGLVALGGYTTNTDIRSVTWNYLVRGQRPLTQAAFTLCYKNDGNGNYVYSGNSAFSGGAITTSGTHLRYSKFPSNYEIQLFLGSGASNYSATYFIGDFNSNGDIYNGYAISMSYRAMFSPQFNFTIFKVSQGQQSNIGSTSQHTPIKIKKEGSSISFIIGSYTLTDTVNFNGTGAYNEGVSSAYLNYVFLSSTSLKDLDSGITLNNAGIGFAPLSKNTADDVWVSLLADFSTSGTTYTAGYRVSDDLITWSELYPIELGADIGETAEYIQYYLYLNNPSDTVNILNCASEVISNELQLRLVNLSGKTVLEALQDFALISGYEFGVDRQGVFFFRPRSQSTTPIYQLDHSEIVKVDTVKKNLNDFFTKLTLSFAQIPLEFYADEGERPTPVDRYGVINKEIDKPEIVNYDNPELAQAIGPQLLALYSSLTDVIQVTAKLNLSLELGDIVNLKRSYDLTVNPQDSDYGKFIIQNTYYRACKITGINYNFSKKQMTYTLRDVSNENNSPQISSGQFPYDLPIQF